MMIEVDMASFIEFDNVSKIYRSGEVEIAALREASFAIEAGELCVIVGESGAGKTTLPFLFSFSSFFSS